MADVRPEVEVRIRGETVQSDATGVLVAPSLVLTAGHVLWQLAEAPDLEVAVKDGESEGAWKCRVVWRGETVDAALLQIQEDEAWRARDLPIASMDFGEIVGQQAVPCQVVGYVRAGPDLASRGLEQLFGRIHPLPGRKSKIISVRMRDQSFRADGLSLGADKWSGLSGSPVYARGVLVGVVNQLDRGVENGLLAVPVSEIFADRAAFRVYEQNSGEPPKFRDVGRPGTSFEGLDDPVIESVANTDASDTQRVGAMQLALSQSYYVRVLAQAKASFQAALVSAAIGLGFFLGAIAFVLSQGQTDAAILSTVSGAIVETVAGLNFWLYARSATQLSAFHARLESMQRFLVANSVARNVEDRSRRDETISNLVLLIAKSATVPSAPVGEVGDVNETKTSQGQQK